MKQLTPTEIRDLTIFMRGLPERARDDALAIRVFAALFAELYDLPAEHVIRVLAADPPATLDS